MLASYVLDPEVAATFPCECVPRSGREPSKSRHRRATPSERRSRVERASPAPDPEVAQPGGWNEISQVLSELVEAAAPPPWGKIGLPADSRDVM